MEMIPRDILAAGLKARDRLSGFARTTAEAHLTEASSASSTQNAMAGAARASIFADAMLRVMHARLEELKSVSSKT
jgi:hypothetical protein